MSFLDAFRTAEGILSARHGASIQKALEGTGEQVYKTVSHQGVKDGMLNFTTNVYTKSDPAATVFNKYARSSSIPMEQYLAQNSRAMRNRTLALGAGGVAAAGAAVMSD